MNDYQLTQSERLRRTFSESFKRKKVQEIETGQSKISEICRQYQVTANNVSRWIKKHGNMQTKKERLIVESQSDTIQLLGLKQRVAELERIVGQKQILIDFQSKMIDIAEETYGVDIKKKFATEPSNPSIKSASDTLIR